MIHVLNYISIGIFMKFRNEPNSITLSHEIINDE